MELRNTETRHCGLSWQKTRRLEKVRCLRKTGADYWGRPMSVAGPTARWQKPRKISAQLKSDANAVRVTASQGKSQSRATAIAVPVEWLTDRGLLATTAMPFPLPHKLRQILADRGGHSR